MGHRTARRTNRRTGPSNRGRIIRVPNGMALQRTSTGLEIQARKKNYLLFGLDLAFVTHIAPKYIVVFDGQVSYRVNLV